MFRVYIFFFERDIPHHPTHCTLSDSDNEML
jgi:hypothetical protein